MVTHNRAARHAWRQKEPDLPRPFKAPFYQMKKAIALAGSVFTLGVFVVYSAWCVTTLFVRILVVCVGVFRVLVLPKMPKCLGRCAWLTARQDVRRALPRRPRPFSAESAKGGGMLLLGRSTFERFTGCEE